MLSIRRWWLSFFPGALLTQVIDLIVVDSPSKNILLVIFWTKKKCQCQASRFAGNTHLRASASWDIQRYLQSKKEVNPSPEFSHMPCASVEFCGALYTVNLHKYCYDEVKYHYGEYEWGRISIVMGNTSISLWSRIYDKRVCLLLRVVSPLHQQNFWGSQQLLKIGRLPQLVLLWLRFLTPSSDLHQAECSLGSWPVKSRWIIRPTQTDRPTQWWTI